MEIKFDLKKNNILLNELKKDIKYKKSIIFEKIIDIEVNYKEKEFFKLLYEELKVVEKNIFNLNFKLNNINEIIKQRIILIDQNRDLNFLTYKKLKQMIYYFDNEFSQNQYDFNKIKTDFYNNISKNKSSYKAENLVKKYNNNINILSKYNSYRNNDNGKKDIIDFILKDKEPTYIDRYINKKFESIKGLSYEGKLRELKCLRYSLEDLKNRKLGYSKNINIEFIGENNNNTIENINNKTNNNLKIYQKIKTKTFRFSIYLDYIQGIPKYFDFGKIYIYLIDLYLNKELIFESKIIESKSNEYQNNLVIKKIINFYNLKNLENKKLLISLSINKVNQLENWFGWTFLNIHDKSDLKTGFWKLPIFDFPLVNIFNNRIFSLVKTPCDIFFRIYNKEKEFYDDNKLDLEYINYKLPNQFNNIYY